MKLTIHEMFLLLEKILYVKNIFFQSFYQFLLSFKAIYNFVFSLDQYF